MQIKEVLLESEKLNIENFLKKFDLKYDKDIIKTFYCEENEKIYGTISCSDYIIKDLAVDESLQGENVASLLINEVLQFFRQNNIFSYQVFTKPKYLNVFNSFGFRKVVETEKVLMLEGGLDNINDTVDNIKTKVEMSFAMLDESSDVGAIVLNANPITNGHVYLIEEAAKRHKILLLFVVEEDKSVFSFKERLSLVYLATKRIPNVCVIESSKYIVSSLTFPDYFLKNETEKVSENAKVDALIFRDYFMKKLYIKKRYVGSESTNKMEVYNEELKNILGDNLEIIQRLQVNNEDISAKRVRNLLEEGKFDEALEYIPRECAMVFSMIARMKYAR